MAKGAIIFDIKNKNLILAIAVVILLNLVAHFLPFERSAFAPDDYGFLWHAKNLSVKDIVIEAPRYTNRPLLYLFGFIQEKFVALNWKLGLVLVFLSSTFFTIIVFLIMLELLGDAFLALFGAIFYLLLPNKLDLYHTLIYVNLTAAYIAYSLSFVLFIYFAKSKRQIFLFFSILCYTIAIFWYEVGFFLPLVLFVYTLLYERKVVKTAFYFLVPAIFYILFRMTGAFGFVDAQAVIGIRDINISNIPHNIFIMLPNHYLGRYVIRAIVYGIYKFPSIEMPWLLGLILIDVIAIFVFIKWLKDKQMSKIEWKLVFFASIMFISFLIPNFMYMIESRHTALSSIGFTILCLALLRLFKVNWKRASVAVFLLFLIVSQGASWTQVVACRINKAVFDYLVEHKEYIRRSERVLIDNRSFADNIPYTWGEKQGNMLDCYWGMQAFAPWGLSLMVPLAVGEEKLVYVGRTRPKVINDKLEFEVQVDGPYTETETVPKKGTFIVDYDKVYADGFNEGKRGK